jgi:uncharacterized protein (TIGR03790 family)
MICLVALAALKTSGIDVRRVLVIENSSSPTSVEIATEYLAARHVKNLLKIQCQDSAVSSDKETMPYADFKDSIETPLRAFLASHPKIDFIVLTKGIPIRLTGANSGEGGTRPSLDSTIAALDYADRKDTAKITLNDSGFTGKAWANRFWNSQERFSHAKFGGYLVTRLDGYTAEEAEMLVKYSLAAEKAGPQGTILLDTAPGHGLGDVKLVPRAIVNMNADGTAALGDMNYNDYDADMVEAASVLEAKKIPVLLDRNEAFVGHRGDLMGYCSWGSNDPKFDADGYRLLRFNAGAIVETAVSTSARTFLPTTGGQSLIADLIRGRITGVKGYCDEPLLQAVASPTVLFDRYTRGWTLAESFYAASRVTGWEDIVVGDPLCCPYGK